MKISKWLAIPIFVGIAALATIAMPTGVQRILSDGLTKVLMNIKSFQANIPQDKVYLHLDKPLYKPGETVWLSAYVRDATTMQKSTKSGIIKVQLINPKGGIDKEISIIGKNGVAVGDFDISEYAPGGIYKVKAFTNWQKNDPNPAFFEKEITVQKVVLPRLKMKVDFLKKAYGKGDEVALDLSIQTNANQPLKNTDFNVKAALAGSELLTQKGKTNDNGTALIKFNLPKDLSTNDGLVNIIIDYQGQAESISRSIPIVLNKVTVQLLPEGGHLVNGLKGRVAFRAANEFGKPADISGVVVNSKGEEITKFESYHQGMGSFDLTPKADEKYTVKITKPVGVEQTFDVPKAKENGAILGISKTTKTHIYANIQSTEERELFIITRIRGKQYFAMDFTGTKRFTIPTDEMPAGVAQVTIFDKNTSQPIAERLTFVNKHKKLHINIRTNKEKYLPREKVKMTINVTDENDKPTAADLSLSVVDDQLLAFADDKSSNIMSWLLMESDIREKVEEPNFYFDPKEEKADKALDYLLMTAGWRRYSWNIINQGYLPAMPYKNEAATVGGFVYDNHKYKPIANATVKVMGTNIVAKTDETGKYSISNLDLTSNKTLEITAKNHRKRQLTVTVYDVNYTAYLVNNDIYKQQKEEAKRKKELENRRRNAERRRPRVMAGGAVPPPPAVMEVPEEEMVDDVAFEAIEEVVEEAEIAPVIRQKPKPKAKLKPVKKEENLNKADNGVLKDRIAVADEKVLFKEELAKKSRVPVAAAATYYKAKTFPKPIYAGQKDPEIRDDFRSTIYWNGHVEIGETGRKTIEFYASDAITSFNITAEGIGKMGTVGRKEQQFFTQKPFSLVAKLPTEIVQGDVMNLPLTFVNNSDEAITGELKINLPAGLAAAATLPETVTLQPNKAITKYLKINTLYPNSEKKLLKIGFKAKGFRDALETEMTTIPKGFPVVQSYSGKELTENFEVNIEDLVDGSLEVNLKAYPNIVSEMMTGLEAMLREPHGCFEQTSSSTYPNILVLNYLIKTGQSKPEIAAKAKRLIEKGYNRLISFESKSGGFEWFGGDPAHEGLTAYGLMEFIDMKAVYDGVDDAMVERTANWLFSRRDGKGGFGRNPRALHSFGLTDEATMSIYITWALIQAKFDGLQTEIDYAYNKAMQTKNPYQLGLAANILYEVGDKARAKKVLEELMSIQLENGSWEFENKHKSAPGSSGNALRIETAALALTALLKSENPHLLSVKKCAEFLRNSRGGYGGFGNTNSTVLALRGLLAYAEFMKKTDESGEIVIFVNDEEVARQTYEKGVEKIEIKGLEEHLKSGKQKVTVKFIDAKNPLPTTLSVNYHCKTPPTNDKCVIGLDVKLANKTVKMGETNRLTTTITNKTAEGQPMTLAIVGIPAGLSAQPWQLKELIDKKVVDFYEIIGNNVVFYYRQMKPEEVRVINLDLKADIPGDYEAPASTAYLYYTNELKSWVGGSSVKIQ